MTAADHRSGSARQEPGDRQASRQDLERARAFYRDQLGLEPVEEREGGLRYCCAAGEFHVFLSSGRASDPVRLLSRGHRIGSRGLERRACRERSPTRHRSRSRTDLGASEECRETLSLRTRSRRLA